MKGIIEYLFQDGEQILYLLNIQVMIYIVMSNKLDQVINYLSSHNVSNNNSSSSSSNEQSFEKDVEIHNYVSNEHDIFLMRKKHLEKDTCI